MFDEKQLRKTLLLMKPDNQLFEVRIIFNNAATLSGYFTDVEKLISALREVNIQGECNVYITLNSINTACYDRFQRDRFERNAKITTSDGDVIGYDWLMVDLDPKRPSGTSSSDEEFEEAKILGNKVFQFMRDLGFSTPLLANSGNGVHLLYRIRLKNTDENRQLVKKCLQTLAMLFTSSKIDLDLTNFNPSRICKLYGTKAQKGANSSARPHRMSYVIGEPKEIEVNDIKYLQKLCDLYPKEEKPQKYNNYKPSSFDLEEWLNRFCIRYTKESYPDGTKFVLDQCPFDSNHKGKDACVFLSRTGAIGFHCFHNSCSDKTWKDVRLLFEPDAYEKKQQEYERKIYSKEKRVKSIQGVDGKPVFYKASDIFNMPKTEETFVRTGITEIDKKLRGLKKGYVSVISGLRASAKSTLLSGICLDCVENENRVGIFSGELSAKNFMRWLNLQAAGKGFVEPTQFDGYYNVKREYQEKISEWLGDKFYLYNNEYGNDFVAIMEQFRKKIDENNLDVLILDNLMAFNITSLSDSKWDAQTEFVLSLKRLAVEKDVHIVFVAHPRKAMGFLRLDDISGTGDLGNAVDNAFIVHRVNNDFIRLTKQMFGWKDDNEIYKSTNVIEIAKDRDGGVQDCFIPLWYEKETKRLKNNLTENKVYGWNKDGFGFCDTGNLDIPFED